MTRFTIAIKSIHIYWWQWKTNPRRKRKPLIYRCFRIVIIQSSMRNHYMTLYTVHDWMTALDNKTQIDAILLDFAKAFDKVPHTRLLSKLTSYGIAGNTHNMITSFLSNRKQRVSVNGALSDITYGQFQRHGHYISDIFWDFRSSFHIPASVKSQIIHSHYKAVIMDSGSYEVEFNCLNQLWYIVYNDCRHGHYIFWKSHFAYQYICWKVCEFMDSTKAFSLLNYW